MKELIATLLALVLPTPERQRHEREAPVDLPFWSQVVGWIQMSGGFAYLFSDYFVTMQVIAGQSDAVMGDAAFSTNFDERLAANWIGAFNAVLWFFQPHVLFGLLVVATGVVRIAAFIGPREAVGEPLVTIAVRLVRALRNRGKQMKVQASLGPERPDRFLPGENGERILLSARQRADWLPGISVDLDGTIFQVVRGEVECPPGESSKVWAYYLQEQPVGQIIRRMVLYEPR